MIVNLQNTINAQLEDQTKDIGDVRKDGKACRKALDDYIEGEKKKQQ